MKTVTLRSAVALLSVCALAVGCTSTRTQRSAGETIDDTAITAKVKAELIDNDKTSAGQIEVETYRGVVQLNGFVDSAAEKAQATTVATGVNGVMEVQNNLAVNTATATAGEVIDDSILTAKVKAKLIESSDTKAHEINVETKLGVVHLSGFVDTATAKAKASELARSVSGVKDVKNEISVKTS